MAAFMVRRYHMAVWDKSEPSLIEPSTMREAAEQACGSGVRESGRQGELCAEVWLAAAPEQKTPFYRSN
jgi:hypothetical protein